MNACIQFFLFLIHDYSPRNGIMYDLYILPT